MTICNMVVEAGGKNGVTLRLLRIPGTSRWYRGGLYGVRRPVPCSTGVALPIILGAWMQESELKCDVCTSSAQHLLALFARLLRRTS